MTVADSEATRQDEAGSNWEGWRRFVVGDRADESAVVTSFYLRPVDGRPVARYRAGQYLILKAMLPGAGKVIRSYTVSGDFGGEGYRISVKREPDGTMSRWLHGAASRPYSRRSVSAGVW